METSGHPGIERGPGARVPALVRRFGPLFVPAILAFAVQSPSLWHGFAGDDFLILLDNPQITGSSSLSDLLLSDWFDSGGKGAIGYYRPVTKASFRLTWAVAGPSAFAFHAGNLAAHAAAVLFLTALLVQLLDRRIALVGASLWGLHPMTVQAIQNVTARSDVLAGTFFLGTLALVAAWARTGRSAWLAAALLSTALALGSKESAVLVPVAAGAVVLALGLGLKRSLVAFAATGLSAAALLSLRLAVLHVSPLANSLAELDTGRRLASILKALGTYALSLLAARPIVRLPQVPRDAFDAEVLAGAVVAIALVAILVSTRLRSPAALGVVVLGASLAPALAIWHLRIPMWKGEIPVAERWLYLPAAGLAILAASVLQGLPRRTGLLAGSGLAAALALGTWQLNPAYASTDAYNDWAAGAFLSSPPRNPRERYLAHFFRARRLRDEGRNEDALRELLAADRIGPWLPDHLWQMAEVQIALGRPSEAVDLVERLLSPAFRQDPAGVAQRIEMGNDALERISGASGLQLLARARAAAGDAQGAREALSASGSGAATPAGAPPDARATRPESPPPR